MDDSAKKALHLHGIFGDIVGDLIDMAIKQALIKPIAGALFGGSGEGGSGGGGLGGLFGSIVSAIGGGGSTATPGFASGGGGVLGGKPGIDQNTLSLNGNPIARVGAGELLSVMPSGMASNQRVNAPNPNVTVLQPIHADFTGARTDEQTMREFQTYADARSKQAYEAAVATAGAQAPTLIRQQQQLR